jgi:hypothetical protein
MRKASLIANRTVQETTPPRYLLIANHTKRVEIRNTTDKLLLAEPIYLDLRVAPARSEICPA